MASSEASSRARAPRTTARDRSIEHAPDGVVAYMKVLRLDVAVDLVRNSPRRGETTLVRDAQSARRAHGLLPAGSDRPLQNLPRPARVVPQEVLGQVQGPLEPDAPVAEGPLGPEIMSPGGRPSSRLRAFRACCN